MARQFNGISDSLQSAIAIDLSAYSTLSVSLWLWWDAFANDDKFLGELTPNFNTNPGSFVFDPNSSEASAFFFGIGDGATRSWSDSFPRPSAAAWHHIVITMDRATPVNTAFVDGVAQSLTAVNHIAASYGNYANAILYMMSRNNTAVFGAGRLAELALWGNLLLSQSDVNNLYNSGNGALATSVQSGSLVNYWRILGDASPEPPLVGSINLTVNGATQVAHPFTLPSGASVVSVHPLISFSPQV